MKFVLKLLQHQVLLGFFAALLMACAVAVFFYSGVFADLQMKVSVDERIQELPESLAQQRIFFTDLIKTYGGLEVYRSFASSSDELNAGTHTQAHVFGEALYEVEGMKGIKVCDEKFRFGCYHSFFGIAIYNEGIEMLPELDEFCIDAYGTSDTRCQHGLGHGIVVYTGYENLLEALELCASLESWQPTGSCSGGVFMEYNFHTMEEAEGVYFTREPGEDVYEPCTSLPEKFQPSCYHEQVQWWLSVYKNDFVYVGTLCQKLEKDSLSWDACYQRVGNFVTEYIGAQYDTILDICSQMENEDAGHLCREGSTFPMTGIKEFRDTRLQMCETLEGDVKMRCIQYVDGWGGGG